MFNMKTTTVREVQHNLSKILRWIEDGEEVVITRRRQVVANLVPSVRERGRTEWPDFEGRMRAIWGKLPSGKPASQIIIDERDERL